MNNPKIMIVGCCMVSLIFFLSQLSFSAPLINEATHFQSMTMTYSDYQQLSMEQQKEMASTWTLTSADYSRYLWLMQYTMNGMYYADKHLDPSWILGFNAKNDEERKKFAEIAIKNERVRIGNELAFQRLFSERYRELYPNELPISYALKK